MPLLLDRAKYSAAVQNPLIAFKDNDLKFSTVIERVQGSPLAYSGTFATTFKLKNSTEEWAVRCFNKNIPDLQLRYSALDSFIDIHQPKFLEKAIFFTQGIQYDSNWYPIVKMPWVKGQTIDLYIEKNIDKPEKLAKLAPRFLKLIKQMQNYGIAHGDLQQGNILVKGETLVLVDYDGFFLPEISYLTSTNAGHENFQHPNRQPNQFNSKMDLFSAIVIYLSIVIIINAPNPKDLWEKYYNGDNLLFKREDFLYPQTSKLIIDSEKIPEISQYILKFKTICQGNVSAIPTLEEFISGDTILASEIKKQSPNIRSPKTLYPIIAASNSTLIKKHLGEKIIIIGQINDLHQNKAYNGKQYAFLNFGKFPNQTFQLVLWSEALELLSSRGSNPKDYEGKWVSVTGIVSRYGNTPQFEIENPTQIQILSGENEAKKRLTFSSDEFGEQILQKEILEKIIKPKVEEKPKSPKLRFPMPDEELNNYPGVSPSPAVTNTNKSNSIFDTSNINQKDEDKQAKVFGNLYNKIPNNPSQNVSPVPPTSNFSKPPVQQIQPTYKPPVNQPKPFQPNLNSYFQPNNFATNQEKPNYPLIVTGLIVALILIGFILYFITVGFSGTYMNGALAIISTEIILFILYIIILKGFNKI